MVMSMPYSHFPFFINITGLRFDIAGGGAVALRRVQSLLHFDCRITVYAREFCEGLKAEAEKSENAKNLSLVEKTFSVDEEPFVFNNSDYAVAATNDRSINSWIGAACRARGVPVSVADCKEESTFYFPALVFKDEVVAGLSSCGLDPAATRRAAAVVRDALQMRQTFDGQEFSGEAQ
jgi:siroheme synthase-like protein